MTTKLASQSTDIKNCIQECWSCHSVCLQTVEYCLQKGGKHADVEHVRLLANCAEICQTSFNFMLSGSPFHMRSCELCSEICDQCAVSCEQFSADEQMRLCAEACRSCAESCRNMSGRARAA